MLHRIGIVAFALLVGAAVAAAATTDLATERFDKLKALSGSWTTAGGDGSITATYHVTAAGSAVVETLFPGTPHEMVTIFTIDRGDLVLTHYCAEGNQPRMKAAKGGAAGAIEFKYDGGGNMKSDKDGHMHEATFTFTDANHLTATWQYYKDGKPGEKESFNLVRKES